jgi:hypothetical protein
MYSISQCTIIPIFMYIISPCTIKVVLSTPNQ